jgi:hypothetical protein
MRDPKEITVTDGDGKARTFTLTKMPAVEGFEIMARYPASLASSTVPKIADWPLVEGLQLKIMKYVHVDINGRLVPLSTQALIDNHAGDWECFAKLIAAEVEYNNRFFRNGSLSTFFAEVAAQTIQKISATLSRSSASSSPTS